MKIEQLIAQPEPINKIDTEVGEVYAVLNRTPTYFLRCQGGFVSLGNGAYYPFDDFSATNPLIPVPDAKLVV